jgi:enoyl-[acyl-carrier protein] reductase II
MEKKPCNEKQGTGLLNILGSKYPIIQGPVVVLNSPQFVADICEAGAFGILALGYVKDPEKARSLIEGVKELTDKPFGANLIAINPNTPRLLEILAQAGVKTVTTAGGGTRRIYPIIHDLGMRGLHVVLSLSHALQAVEGGANGVIASGAESGGLRTNGPESSTMILVPLIVDHVKVPVVAAGGIADARGFRAALTLGAQGVQIATRFIASRESPAHEQWKQAILDSTDSGTTLFPLGNGLATRVIITAKLREAVEKGSGDIAGMYDAARITDAWEQGNFDLFPAGAGQTSSLIRAIKPVREIVSEMVG